MEWLNRVAKDTKKISLYLFVCLTSLFLADLVALSLRQDLLPQTFPSSTATFRREWRQTSAGELAAIVGRNVFNADGVIATPMYAADEIDEKSAVRSSLDLALLATIVNFDPTLSLAAVKRAGETSPKAYRKGDMIENQATVLKINRGRIYFRNLNNNRLEYLDMLMQGPALFGELARQGADDGSIRRDSDTDYRVTRDELKKQTANLPQLLQQARAVPHMNATGALDGFRITMIQAGSVFEKLGIQTGDVVKSVNGQPLDSPTKAMELYNALRDAPSVSISVERNGRVETFNYSMN